MRDKIKKALGILLATASLSVAFVGCGKGALDYKGDAIGDGYVSSATVSSNGGFAVEKGDYIYFINGQTAQDANNEYGEVVKGALMRISKADLQASNFSNVKTIVPALLSARDIDAGIYIYGDYVYYATPTTDTTEKGESVADTHIDFKRAKLDGSEGPMKDYFLRLSDNASRYRFVEENGTVYCLYEETVDGKKVLKSVNTENKKITTLVKGAQSAFFFDAKNPTNPNVYYTMNVQKDLDSPTESYNQIYRVNAGATANVDEDNAKYTAYDAKGNKIKEYAFDKGAMEEANEKAEDEDRDEPYDFEDYTTYPYVNLGTLVLDGVGKGGDKYIPQTQYNWETDRSACMEFDGFTYSLGEDCYQDGEVYFTRKKAGATTGSDATDTKLYYLTDEATKASDWKTIGGNVVVSSNVVALDTKQASTGSALFYEEKGEKCYIYAENNNLYKASKSSEPVCIANGVGTVKLWKLDEAEKELYFYSEGTNGNTLSRVNYGGDVEDYNALHGKEEFQVVSLSYLSFNPDWYMPELFGDTVLYSGAQSYAGATYEYIYATKMGSVADVKKANEDYKKAQDKLNEYSAYADLKKALEYYYKTGETAIFEEFRADYSTSKGNEFDKFVAMFEENGELYGMRESDFIKQVGKTSQEDKDAMTEAWREYVRKYAEEAEAEEEGLPTWAIWLISCGSAVFVLAVAVIVVRTIKRRKARKAEAEATVNAYKRKKIDTTDDKSIDVYADEEAEETEAVVDGETVEETEAVVDEETVEEAVKNDQE
ncbi:MAG: cytochrome c-type biogenesis protein CcmH [Clostridiales bacterium]|nr:cytochrome c-type biogenesis protein CcmH [Clostridiales bacterium]